MSYILTAPVDTSGFVSNPLTSELDADGQNISGAGTITFGIADGNTVQVAGSLTHTDPTGVIGFYGAGPTPQFDPILDLVGHGEVGDAINSILEALRRIGVVAQ